MSRIIPETYCSYVTQKSEENLGNVVALAVHPAPRTKQCIKVADNQ
jgi:hypothetical protein